MEHRLWKLVVVGAIVACMAATAMAQQRVIVNADYGVGNRYRADVTAQVQAMVRGNQLSFVVTNQTLGIDPDRGQRKNLCIHVRERNGRVSEYRFQENETVNLRFDWEFDHMLRDDAQRRFDDAYGHWLDARHRQDWDEVDAREKLMREIMYNNRIPPETPFDDVASPEWEHAREGWGRGLRIERAMYGTDTRTVDVTGKLQSMVRDNHLEFRVTADTIGTDPAEGRFKRLFVTYTFNGDRREIAVDEKSVLRIP
jgi:Domain of unknown function (DUF3395)